MKVTFEDVLFSPPSIRRAYEKARRPIEAAGGVLIVLGCRLAASK